MYLLSYLSYIRINIELYLIKIIMIIKIDLIEFQ